MSNCDCAFYYPHEEEINLPVYMSLPEYLVFRDKTKLIKEKVYVKKTKKHKTKFCNFIFSNEVKSRNNFFSKLSKYKKIDSPGKCMNNMPSLEKEGREDASYKEWVKTKLNFMKNYKFTLAFENRIIPGYTDEKIYHAMLSGSIPIYFGNKFIHKDFNPKSFINCHEFKNFGEVIKRIVQIDKNDKLYEEYLSQPWFYKNKPSKYMDEGRILKRLKEIINKGKNK